MLKMLLKHKDKPDVKKDQIYNFFVKKTGAPKQRRIIKSDMMKPSL
jgi:hypothetical protein